MKSDHIKKAEKQKDSMFNKIEEPEFKRYMFQGSEDDKRDFDELVPSMMEMMKSDHYLLP